MGFNSLTDRLQRSLLEVSTEPIHPKSQMLNLLKLNLSEPQRAMDQ